ncbi:hypothetical protein K501DRAFT_288120 [Backusella circina FSU 941]|nr:hypothetical protein K501DRAFT_288120 [Backusella circina FSU 941]
MAASIMKIAVEHTNPSQVMCCIYSFFLAALLIPVEFKTIEKISSNVQFNTNYRGRGVIIGLFGCIVLGSHVFLLVAGILDLIFGFACIVFSFLSALPAPKSIINNWQNWEDFCAEGLDLDRPKEVEKKSPVRSTLAASLKKISPW